MKKMINRTVVEGYLYDNKLEKKVYKDTAKRPGEEYIQGTIDIATDDAITNIVSVHFSFVSMPDPADANDSKKQKGYMAKKQRFEILSNIMNGTIKSVMNSGKDNAAKLSVSSSISLAEWYSDRNGSEELVSTKRNEGGFIRSASPLQDEDKRNTFDVDMILIGARRVEADEERGYPEKVVISGWIFDFWGALMPVDFTVLLPGAMNYFEGLEPSRKSPVFTRLKGKIVSTTVKRNVTVESAWDSTVKETDRPYKDWIVDWAQPEEYEFDDENTITAEEVKTALANREVMLSELKNRRKDAAAASAFDTTDDTASKSKYSVKKSTVDFNF